jgi:acyl-CoA hydrolase
MKVPKYSCSYTYILTLSSPGTYFGRLSPHVLVHVIGNTLQNNQYNFMCVCIFVIFTSSEISKEKFKKFKIEED